MPSRKVQLQALLFLITLAVPGLAQIQSFLSNPSLAPPTLAVETKKAELADDGYIFVTPFLDNQPSPLIYDSNGTLIWDGLVFATLGVTHDLTVCEYEGSPHLCFIDATQMRGFARGHGDILDPTYSIVQNVTSGNGVSSADQHEFRVIENGSTALITVYEQILFNTSTFGIQNVTWVTTGIFQEVDIASGQVLFQWSSIDHVPVNETYVLPKTTDISGDGQSNNTPWDYFHINSVDKNVEGDYLVSARHVKTIYKISGVDGHIIWRLGGKRSTFTMDYEFNFQHNARYRDDNGAATTISLYDNGSDDSLPEVRQTMPGYESVSSGIVAVVNTDTGTSTIIERYFSPGNQLSTSQGNLEFLPNGNRMIGMGSQPYVVEFTNNATGEGEVVFYAYLSLGADIIPQSYRVYKFPWSAQPASSPDLFAYSQTCNSQTVFYVSWNGATRVASWVFMTSNSTDGPFSQATSVPKVGFETIAMFQDFNAYSYVEAVDNKGTVLGRSPITVTFVPAPDLIYLCTDTACPAESNYTTATNQTCSTTGSK